MVTREAAIAELLRRGLEVPNEALLSQPEQPKDTEVVLAAKQELVRRGLEDPSILAPENPSVGGEFVSGVKRGAAYTGALVSEGVPAVAQSLMNKASEALTGKTPFDVQENVQAYQDKIKEAQIANPSGYRNYQDVKSLGDVLPFAAGAIGEQVPNLAASIATGGAGALGTKLTFQQLIKRAGKEYTEDQIKKAMLTGAVSGLAVSSATQNIPESYLNLAIQGEDSPLTALAVGALKTSLDVLPQANLAKNFLGPDATDLLADSLIKRFGREAGRTAVAEGATEAAQTGLDQIAEELVLADNKLFSKENAVNLVDAGIKGALVGGLFGGASTLLEPRAKQSKDEITPEEQAKVDETFKEEVVGKASDNKIMADVPPPVTELGDFSEALDNEIIKSGVFTNEQKAVLKEMDAAPEQGLSLTPEEMVDLQNTYTLAKTPELGSTLDKVYNGVNAKKLAALKVTPDQLVVRKDAIAKGERPDTFFVPGDGEIVAPKPRRKGDKITQLEPMNTFGIKTPVSKIKAKKPKKVSMSKDPKGSKKPKAVKVGLKGKPLTLVRDEAQKKAKQVQAEQQAKTQKDTYSFDSDPIADTVIANNLVGKKASPTTLKEYKGVLTSLNRIGKEVLGPGFPVVPMDFMLEVPVNERVAGAAHLNHIYVALETKRTEPELVETMFHEAFHTMLRPENKFFTYEQIRQMLDNAEKLLPDFMQDGYLKKQDFEGYLVSDIGREELVANAAGKRMADMYLKRESFAKKLPALFQVPFRKAFNYLMRLKSAFNANGAFSYDTIFTTALEGKRPSEAMLDVFDTQKKARMQKIADAYNEAHEKTLPDLKEAAETMRQLQNARTDTAYKGKDMSRFATFIQSSAHLASKHPFVAVA